jgi:hypothetical protein
MEDDFDSLFDDDEEQEKHRKVVEQIEECCAMWDKWETYKPAIEKALADLVDQFYAADVARLTPYGMWRIGRNVSTYSWEFYVEITYAMLYKNDSRPDRYIPSPPKEVDEEPTEGPEPEAENFDDWDLSNYPPDPANEYSIKCDEIADQFLNATIRSMKTLAAEHYSSEIMTLSAEGYRFLDAKIFELADEFAVVGVADLFYKDCFIDGYKQLIVWASGRSFTLPHCRPERLDPSALDEYDIHGTRLYLEGVEALL